MPRVRPTTYPDCAPVLPGVGVAPRRNPMRGGAQPFFDCDGFGLVGAEVVRLALQKGGVAPVGERYLGCSLGGGSQASLHWLSSERWVRTPSRQQLMPTRPPPSSRFLRRARLPRMPRSM